MSQGKTALVTGANRGIGLGLTEQLLAKGWEVHAAARNPDGARELWEAERDFGSRCKIHELDVTNDADLKKLADSLEGKPIDLLINNAGVLPEGPRGFAELTADSMLKGFTVNVLGPMRVTQRLLPNLQASPRGVVVTISSKMGSITDNTSGGSYAYRTSKAAVNMLMKSFAVDHPGLISIVMHPGWVKTARGGSEAPLTVEKSVEGMLQVIQSLKPEHSGRFFEYSGKELPW
jgi:NAD(P)-dependent dehydrogenase (short-subunit alcohol dehydrogenase family)